MNYKDKRLAGTVECIREYCEDSKDFQPTIENEAGVYDLFLIKMEKLDPKAYTYANAYAYANAYTYAFAFAYANAYTCADACAYVGASARACAHAKLKQLFIESIKESEDER